MKMMHPLRVPPRARLRASLGLIAALTLPAFALDPAQWRFGQTLDVQAPGLIRIDLPPATLSAAQPELQDLRLLDAAGTEQPFVIEQPAPQPASRRAPKSFTSSLAAKSTILVMETGIAKPINGITLDTPARSFVKAVRVEGSHDAKEWQDLATGRPIFRLPDGAARLDVEFAPGVWEFLRLTIDDQRAGPVPFTGALVWGEGTVTPVEPVAAIIKSRDDSSGITRLALDLGAANLRIARIEIETPEPLFSRSVTIAVPLIVEETIKEDPVASGTIQRISVDGAVAEQLRVSVEKHIRSRELLLLIQNQDSPPLQISAVRVYRRPVHLAFFAREPGRYRLVSGNSQSAAPRYDLAQLAGRLSGASAVHVAPSALVENAGFRAPDPFAGLGETSTPLDVTKWKFRKPVLFTGTGVQQLELDLDVLSRSSPGFADLRLMRGQRQQPYLLERPSILRPLDPQVVTANDPKKPHLSRWSLKFPKPALPLTRITCASPAPLFERTLAVWEEVPDERGGKHPRDLGTAAWRRTPGTPARDLVIDLTQQPQSDTLFLETDNGDNPPIALGSVRAWVPVTRLTFMAGTASPDPVQLCYGNPEAARPRYDLALIAPQLLAAEKATATLAPEQDAKPSAWFESKSLSGASRIIFWAVLALVVIVLLLVLARLVPKAGPQSISPGQRPGEPVKKDAKP